MKEQDHRPLLDVIGGLIVSSDNPSDFHAETLLIFLIHFQQAQILFYLS